MKTNAANRSPAARRFLRIAALLVALGVVGYWAGTGANRGWSKNRVAHVEKDEITGLDHVTYEERFVPGVDTLGLGLGAAAGLFAASFLFRSKKSN